jgi:hypothetical protein
MGPRENVGRSERQPEIAAQDLGLGNPQRREGEGIGPLVGVDHDLPAVDEDPDVAVVMGESRTEIETGVGRDAGAKAEIAGNVETRCRFVRERGRGDGDQQNLGRRSEKARHALCPQPHPTIAYLQFETSAVAVLQQATASSCLR